MTCTFCEFEVNIEPERRIHEYEYWHLVLHRPDKLASTKQAAGLLIAKRHVAQLGEASDVEVTELRDILKDAASRLCGRVGVTYADQETIGINHGSEAGQTVFHLHAHILPVAVEDPAELKVRAGIGGAFEALRRERLQ